MVWRAHRRHDGHPGGGRPLFTWLGRRGSFPMPLAANDNRAPAFHRARRLVSPIGALDALIALVARRR
ncbi:MAG: hypothetical protein ACREER_03150 [Alphaproteobacteria bacterium]